MFWSIIYNIRSYEKAGLKRLRVSLSWEFNLSKCNTQKMLVNIHCINIVYLYKLDHIEYYCAQTIIDCFPDREEWHFNKVFDIFWHKYKRQQILPRLTSLLSNNIFILSDCFFLDESGTNIFWIIIGCKTLITWGGKVLVLSHLVNLLFRLPT